jgi:hypothetical protein
VRLGVVLDKQKVVLMADVSDVFCVGAATIEVDNHYGMGVGSNGLLDE